MLAYFNLRIAVLLGFILRLVWLLFIDINPVSDPGVYDDFARSIVEGRGFAHSDGTLTAFWPVGTSAIYAAIYYTLGYHYIFIALFNLLIGSIIIYLSWSITRHFFDERTATIAAFILALWPLLIQFTTILASELIFILMMLATISIAINTSIKPLWRAILFGLFIGIACYIRPIIFPLLLILPFLKLIRDKKAGEFITCTTTSLLVFILVVSPWSYRNTQLYGEFTLLSTNFGPNLWMGNNPQSDGSYMKMPARAYASEKDRDNQLRAEAINFIRNNPSQYMLLAYKRLITTFGRETIGIVWNSPSLNQLFPKEKLYALKLISTIYWYLSLIAACLGICLYLIKNKWRGIFFTPLVISAYLVSVPLLTVGQDRYHIPLIPFIACFAAYLINYLFCKLFTKEQ